jgi:hypothetical protein
LELSPIQTLKELARIAAAHTGVYMVSREPSEASQGFRRGGEEEAVTRKNFILRLY